MHRGNNNFITIFLILDIDECLTQPCDVNAVCNNTVGTFECICKSGYTGNGFTCTGKLVKLHRERYF